MMVTDIVRGSTDPEGAWQQVVEHYGPSIHAWCQRAGLQSADADDVTQQVFLATFNGMAGLRLDRPGDSFAGWLYAITKNKIRRRCRQLAAAPAQIGKQDLSYTDEGLTCLEWREILAVSLVDAALSVSLPCRRRNNAAAKCIALVLWYLRKIMHSVDELLENIVSRLPFEIAAERLRTVAETTDLPDELDNLRRHSIWTAFKSALKFGLESRLARC